ncbi:MAG: hypothetical protein K5883_00605 [Pseudobutyrivibrio sp.]|nr:hypothetical protein [Pseudobutyrivibrio sp.]
MKKRCFKICISTMAVVGMLLTNKMSLNIHAENKGVVFDGESITLQVGDTATLKCAKNYGYDALDVTWEIDDENVINITDEDPGDTYSSITNASIEAKNPGTAHVSMKAESPWGQYWRDKTESFTVVVEGENNETPSTSVENSKTPEATETPETPSEPEEPLEPEIPSTSSQDDNPASIDGKTLYVRLSGNFSHMMIGEDDIDAVSGATGVGYKPQEANSVTVQAILVEDGTDRDSIADDAWKTVEYFNFDSDAIRPNGDTSKCKVSVTPECPGMEFFYNIWSGKIEASGKPESAGKYNISLEFVDTDGRVATSNSVSFEVYELNNTLLDSLTYENSSQTADGKYIYDQTPWYITEMGADTVVVPKDIKAWFGSHTEGTYAEVGEIISLTNGDQPSHSLVIPSGCNLTLVNTRIHSDVKVIVEYGGKLTLRQSTIEGIIEVKNGGTLSVDYNDYGAGSFLSGSVLNGQVILQEGATLDNAHIVSHTNYSARDDVNRKNNKPIVVVNGNVTFKGEVTIKADEAADYGVGQRGLEVNGTLNIPEGSSLEVYGGGESQLTSKGGDAIILNNGTIQGKGKLIAVGGFGLNLTSDRSLLGGGHAISGSGKILISESNLYLSAGKSFEDVDIPAVSSDVKVGGFTEADEANKTENNDEVRKPVTDITPVNNTEEKAVSNSTTEVSIVTNMPISNSTDTSSSTTNSSSSSDTAKSYPALITAANPQPTTVAEESVPLAKVENTQPPTKKTSTSTVSNTTNEIAISEDVDTTVEHNKTKSTKKIKDTNVPLSAKEATTEAITETTNNNLYLVIAFILILSCGGIVFYKFKTKNK